MIIGIIIAAAAVLIVLFFVSTYNGFVRLRNKCEEAFATMDAYLKKRRDLIPNLVETVKGYTKHESETLEAVIAARNRAVGSGGMAELQESENALTAGLSRIFALAESYPDLKANTNFIDLQQQLGSIEDDILQSRKYYNAVVRSFNTKREVFPQSLVAGMMHLEKKEYFEIDEADRATVQVSF